MNILELLKKINSDEIEDGSIFHGGDLFYKLIVLDRNLYVINEMAKKIEILESHYIGYFIDKNYTLYQYKKVIGD